ncbi:MAG: PepSY domain-containing protein [Rhizobiaceae bacterium]|nr:PepSY domain-containing protein [Rhizobiaceae bacterium]
MNKHLATIFPGKKLYILFFLAFFAAFAGIVSASFFVMADTKSKHGRIYEQQKSKGILPLEVILEIMRDKIKGEIIETEFEYEDGIPVYEFKYISKRGRVREMYVDAKTGVIIKDKLD